MEIGLFILTVAVAYLFVGGVWIIHRHNKHLEWHKEQKK
jgi:cbb3-type cytochrome oxidase subunit 3